MATFVAIVECGSLTKAAERQSMSLTAVVRALATLEESLGVRLLNRSTRRLALTDEGRDYCERCRRLLADLSDMEHAVTARRERVGGRLAITAPTLFGRLHVVPVVTDFLVAHPEMRIELILLDRVVDLLEEGFDLAIRIGPLPDSSLVAVPLGQTARIVCCSPEMERRLGRVRLPGELAGRPAIRFTALGDGNDWRFTRAGEQVRVGLREVLATNQPDAALAACKKGLGYGRFLAYQCREALAAGDLLSILDEWVSPPLPVNVVYPHQRLLSARVRSFIEWSAPRLRERLG